MAPIVIAHRGASGYLPEHTLAAKALAHEMGADYLEQDVVASRDDHLIVLHDIYLDRVTDVAERFPDRARDDGRFYARDFDLVELKQLRAWERMNEDGTAVYPGRYPLRAGEFQLHTLQEELRFIERLNDGAGRTAGVYPEIKKPAWHREEGVDIAPLLLEALEAAGYSGRDDPVYVQCFDVGEVRRLRDELYAPFRVIQLIGENDWGESSTDYDALRTPEGLAGIAEVADGIGPWLPHLFELEAIDGVPVATGLAQAARELGLAIHAYTFRADDLPGGFADFRSLVRFFTEEIGVDGLFTDFPDQAIRALQD